jgi:hypothetical protein
MQPPAQSSAEGSASDPSQLSSPRFEYADYGLLLGSSAI